MQLDFRNTNALWASVAVETLHREGVRHAVVSPGSRNTPLTHALALHPGIDAVPVLDERSAGFLALGLAKATHTPVLLLCTSGSAGAHYLPALIEARESGAPLLVVTADRPPELRDCASGQTIDQTKLFGSHVAGFHELAVPEPRLERLRYLRQTLRQACAEARQRRAGIHLNAPFRDPLPPVEDGSARPLEHTVDWTTFFARPTAPTHRLTAPALPADFGGRRGLVIAGGSFDDGSAALTLAAALGWPVLADPLSGARRSDTGATVVAAYEGLLRNPELAAGLCPEAVVVVGEMPTGKTLRAWLTETDAPTVHFTTLAGNRDGLHGRTLRVAADAAHPAIAPWTGPRAKPDWTAAWARAEAGAQAALETALAAAPASEPAYARALAAGLPAGRTLFVASSMPVRDLEYFAAPRDLPLRHRANRGANGIDGLLSTALGVAHAGEAVVLLVGDLAFLHDGNALLSVPRLHGSLDIVLIDNAGGGIFGHLPIAAFDPPFEDYWATPQRVDFAQLCAAHQIPCRSVETPTGLVAAVSAPPAPGARVWHVRTDRRADVSVRREALAAAARAGSAALSAAAGSKSAG